MNYVDDARKSLDLKYDWYHELRIYEIQRCGNKFRNQINYMKTEIFRSKILRKT